MLLDSLWALLEALSGCQGLWLRLAPIFALPGAAQHMPSECLTFAQVLACTSSFVADVNGAVPSSIGSQKHDGNSFSSC